MPVKDWQECKLLIDGSGATEGGTESLAATTNALKDNVVLGTVADDNDGERWTRKVLDFNDRVNKKLAKFNEEGEALCNSQPVRENE